MRLKQNADAYQYKILLMSPGKSDISHNSVYGMFYLLPYHEYLIWTLASSGLFY